MSKLEHKERLLRKVKLNSGGGATVEWLDVWWNPETQSYVRNSESRTSDGMVHEDLSRAMGKLAEHLAICCEMVPEVKGNHAFDGSLKGLEKFKISSCTLSGGEQEEDGEKRDPVGVHIFGRKRLKDGRVVNFGTPGIKLAHPQEAYKFAADLSVHVEAIETEAWLYLDGKVAPPAQTALDLEGAGELVDGTADLGEAK